MDKLRPLERLFENPVELAIIVIALVFIALGILAVKWMTALVQSASPF